MRTDRNQLDIILDRPPTAADYRAAAEAALSNPLETQEQRQRRHDHYLAEAARLEAIAHA